MNRVKAALEAIGQLPDGEIAIADAALQLARVDAPEGDAEAARAHLSELARAAVDLAGTVAPDDIVGQAVWASRGCWAKCTAMPATPTATTTWPMPT